MKGTALELIELGDVYSQCQRDPSASSYTDKHAIREITHSNPAIPIICPRPVAFRAKGFFIGLAAMAIAWFIAMITSGVMCV